MKRGHPFNTFNGRADKPKSDIFSTAPNDTLYPVIRETEDEMLADVWPDIYHGGREDGEWN